MEVFIIIIVLIFLYFLFFNKKKETQGDVILQKPDLNPPKKNETPTPKPEEPDLLFDENGRKYYLINKTRLIPRKTYLKGFLIGKYHGEADPILEYIYHESKFFDFTIYEATVQSVITNQSPFNFSPDTRFPKEKLPENLPVILEKDSRQFAVNILEPQLQNVVFDRKLHQTEGDEVFGTIKAEITGYILDFIKEDYTERVYIEEKYSPIKEKENASTPTSVTTGKTEKSGNYKRTEYWYSNYKDTYWGNWVYIGPPSTPKGGGGANEVGCFSIIATIIGLIFLVFFLVAIGPKGILGLLIFGAFLLILAFFSEIIKWIFRIILALMFMGLILSVISSIMSKRSFVTPPILIDSLEIKRDSLISNDSIIIQHRKWKDYDDNSYEGDYWIKVKDYASSRFYKNNISASYQEYDDLLNMLHTNDIDKLHGVYHLLDSIKKFNKQSDIQFAETVVSFVQDIPYTLVLDKACDALQYNDPFTRSYLQNNQGDCDPYEKFGINTPVEFMAGLKGDCDTRTLLLYTILSHFGYDVAILSSDYYSHSVLGINLPITGDALIVNGKKYVVWETTSAGIRPGILPREVSNLNYWRISLQSKK